METRDELHFEEYLETLPEDLPASVRRDIIGIDMMRKLLIWNSEKELEYQRSKEPGTKEMPDERRYYIEAFTLESALNFSRLMGKSEDECDSLVEEMLEYPESPQVFDLINRVTREFRIKALLRNPDVLRLSTVDKLRVVIHAQTRYALTQNAEDPTEYSFLESALIRSEGREVIPRKNLILPFISGQNVKKGLREFLNTVDVEFKELDIETAVIKGVIYFSLAMVLHPQMDFNGRVFGSFIDIMVKNSLVNQTASERNTTVFMETEADFMEKHLLEIIRFFKKKLFEHLFPEVREVLGEGNYVMFTETFSPMIMEHQKDTHAVYEALEREWGDRPFTVKRPEERFEINNPTGVVKSQVDEYFIRSWKSNTIENLVYSRLKSLENYNLSERYFSDLLKVGSGIIEDFVKTLLPVMKLMKERNLTFVGAQNSDFLSIYTEVNGNRPHYDLSGIISAILLARSKYSQTDKPSRLDVFPVDRINS